MDNFPSRRRASTLLILALLLGPSAALAAPPAAAAEEPVPTLAGVWKTDKGHYFEIQQEPGATSIASTIIIDPCTGGPRSYVISGTLNGIALTGNMQRCDDLDHPLVVDCDLDPVWETTFFANVTNYEIVGEYEGEYYRYNTDSGGNITSCTLEDHPMTSFTLTRVDCWVKTFDELGEERISDPTKLAAELDLANRAENGEKLLWTEAQRAAGGLKEQAEAFAAELPSWGYTATINSAYRPVLYQAHFADLRICGIQLGNAAIDNPEAASLLAHSVEKVNAEVAEHALKFSWINVSSLHIKVPFVCYREPIETCPHTDQRAVDMSIRPDEPMIDFLGAVHGLCRPYVNTNPPDRPHWDRVVGSPYAVDKCHQLGVGPGEATIRIEGNSPINILVTDSNGQQVGYDPDSGSAVNDFGPEGAFYSGPGSEPQIIEIFQGNAVAGEYSVTGVGTGDGSYSLTGDVINVYGDVNERVQAGGTAQNGSEIEGLTLLLKDDYAPPAVLIEGVASAGAGGAVDYTVAHNGTSRTVSVLGGGVGAVVAAPDLNALALVTDGAGGSTTVVVPRALIDGAFVVRTADGQNITASVSADATGAAQVLTFSIPAGTDFVVISAGPGTTSPAPTTGQAPAGELPWIWIGLAAVAAVAAAALVVTRMRKKQA